MSETPKESIAWKVRPATLVDQSNVNKLLLDSYETLLATNYDADFLSKALPLITQGMMYAVALWHQLNRCDPETMLNHMIIRCD